MIPRHRPVIAVAWREYTEACDKLAVMRDVDSAANALATEMQLQHCEKLLQNWIELTGHFTASLN